MNKQNANLTAGDVPNDPKQECSLCGDRVRSSEIVFAAKYTEPPEKPPKELSGCSGCMGDRDLSEYDEVWGGPVSDPGTPPEEWQRENS